MCSYILGWVQIHTSLKLILIICFKALKPHSPLSFPSNSSTWKNYQMNYYQNKSILYKITISVRHNRVPDNFQIFAKEYLVLFLKVANFLYSCLHTSYFWNFCKGIHIHFVIILYSLHLCLTNITMQVGIIFHKNITDHFINKHHINLLTVSIMSLLLTRLRGPSWSYGSWDF